MELQNLALQNPWWQRKIEDDFHLQKLGKQKYQYSPSFLQVEELQQAETGIYTIIGPRQVGKTTFLKMLIRDLLAREEPHSLFYYSCENNTKEQLREVLLFYLQSIAPPGKKYLFLDEISLVRGWELVELELYNKGMLQQAIIINSGSSSLNLKKSAERLPGRKGKGRLCFFFPLSFREFVFLVEKKASEIDKTPYAFLPLLDQLLEQYVRASGFPSVINLWAQEQIDDATYDIYKDWIEGEIAKAGRSVQFAYQIFARILESLTSQLNWESIAKRSSIRSHTTIADYADLLDSLFITKVVPQIGGDLRINLAKNKKIYFYDHFLFSVIEKSTLKIANYQNYYTQRLSEEVYFSRIVENLVFSNLLKYLADKGFELTNTLFFWRSKTQQEVDFIVLVRKGIKKIVVPIEVKYRAQVEPSQIKTFRPFILSKNTLDHEKSIYPLSLFLFRLPAMAKLE
ncbi:MAG: ATP-binding protein [Nanoarchaeota archaeon]